MQLKEPFLKRPFDFLVASMGLILSSSLWLAFALAIYLEDKGPVFFLQERCGRTGKVFKTIKFRTMKVPKADEDIHKIVVKEHDPRITRVGRVLRASALDELPELINILKGDMSFVGPRPLPLEIVVGTRYKTIQEVPGYNLRSQVRPGLTGIAQIYASKDIDHREKFRYDNIYVKKMSFWLDLKLIFLSFWVTFRGGWERRGKKI